MYYHKEIFYISKGTLFNKSMMIYMLPVYYNTGSPGKRYYDKTTGWRKKIKLFVSSFFWHVPG